jgi:serine/threonine protein kinase
VLEQPAVGGMGSVWMAEDQLLGRRVAIKILAEPLASQPPLAIPYLVRRLGFDNQRDVVLRELAAARVAVAG